MGYGYLGAYLAYGFQVNKMPRRNSEDDSDSDDELECMDACLYRLRDDVYVKRYGTDETPCYFLFWRQCFCGGGFWENRKPNSDRITSLPVSSCSVFKEVEDSFRAETMKEVCDDFGIEYEEPKWQTLITFGQMIY